MSTVLTNSGVTFPDSSVQTTAAAPSMTILGIDILQAAGGNPTAIGTSGTFTIYINGTGFEPASLVYLGDEAASAVTYVSTTKLQAVVSGITGHRTISVYNPTTGASASKPSGIFGSRVPNWNSSSYLNSAISDQPYEMNLSASSDSSITYSVSPTGGNYLPTGFAFSSSGFLSGTPFEPMTTSYSFALDATDAEGQISRRWFSLLVEVVVGSTAYGFSTMYYDGVSIEIEMFDGFMEISDSFMMGKAIVMFKDGRYLLFAMEYGSSVLLSSFPTLSLTGGFDLNRDPNWMTPPALWSMPWDSAMAIDSVVLGPLDFGMITPSAAPPPPPPP